MKPSFACSACGFRFRADARYTGRRVRCPNGACGQSVVLQPVSELAAANSPAAVSAQHSATAVRKTLRSRPAAARGRSVGDNRRRLFALSVAAVCGLTLLLLTGSQLWFSGVPLLAANSEGESAEPAAARPAALSEMPGGAAACVRSTCWSSARVSALREPPPGGPFRRVCAVAAPLTLRPTRLPQSR